MRLLPLILIALTGLAQASAACGPQDKIIPAERLADTVRWTTASEQDNFGYDVYRGNSEKGPFVKLTTKPILGHGSTDETHSYSFRDDSIDLCKAYWYYVESISTSGQRERFTPIFRAKPKRPAVKASTTSAG